MYNILKEILEDLSKYKRNKEELKLYYTEQRLNKSLSAYYESLVQSLKVMYNINSKDVLKELSKDEE